MQEQSLQLGVIGNCSFSALVDERARIVWSCFPRPDGDPIFHALIGGQGDGGFFAVEIEGFVRSDQRYLDNTAVLETTLWDHRDSGVRITDFAPRFAERGRMFRPLMLVRRLEPIGRPSIRIRLRPRFDYGRTAPQVTRGSNHARFVGPETALRLTSEVPITYVLQERAFLLDQPASLIFGVDETPTAGVGQMSREFQERTAHYWRTWVRPLGLPLDWQDAVIRAAITLKLCTFEETGAIVAALTTSIPEAPGTGRTWDYRYCWLRDAFFVVRALNSLSEVATMENYLQYLANLGREAEGDGHLQPVYGIGLERTLAETTVDELAGYRGCGPVRTGNQAFEHHQHDVYGNVVLAATQAFFDRRLLRQPDVYDYQRLQWIGERAFALHDQPDAGMWELRTRSAVHTSSSIMCWAACDRLAKVGGHLGLAEREAYWRDRAAQIRERILREAWSERRQTFVERFGGEELDAGVLLMGEIGFIDPDDPRWRATVATIGRELGRGSFLLRYRAPDDFGVPTTAFLACSFWYIDALLRIGERERARELFEALLGARNHLGLLSEDFDPSAGELWGNFPQTYSMAGIINCAMRLSRRWESVL